MASFHIRPTRPSDLPALSRICLLTGDAGNSAESLYSIPELLGLFYACPYVSLPHTGGLVLTRRRDGSIQLGEDVSATEGQEHMDYSEDVFGYVLFTFDTRAFEDAMEHEWFPLYREKYPKPSKDASVYESNVRLTEADVRNIELLHAPDRAPDACIAFSPAHLHINVLPEAQRQGWGRRLIDSAVTYLRDEIGLSGVWLGMDPRNTDAARFYERIGFQAIDGAPSNYMGLRFENWKSP